MFLIKTTEKILDVRKRLMRTVKHLPSSDPFDDAQTSSTINTPRFSPPVVFFEGQSQRPPTDA